MPRELSEEEYAFLQGRRQVADFVESIYNDPQLNKEAKALVKKKYPQIAIPDYDLEQQFNSRFDEEKRARENAEREKREAEQEREFKTARSEIQKEYGFTDDGMKELEDFMVKNNVGSYKIAAEYRVSKNPKQIESTYNDGFWNHQKQDGFADIAKDPEGWARGEILKTLRSEQERAKGWR